MAGNVGLSVEAPSSFGAIKRHPDESMWVSGSEKKVLP